MGRITDIGGGGCGVDENEDVGFKIFFESEGLVVVLDDDDDMVLTMDTAIDVIMALL